MPVRGASVAAFVDGLPDILAGADFKAVVRALRARARVGAGIIWGIGAHVIKTGLSPVLIDLMERGYVSALAMNGAGIIHDFEVALSGSTSEDVDEALGPGRFGMAEETGDAAECRDQRRRRPRNGIGQAVGDVPCRRSKPPHAGVSLLAAAARLGIPVTVHVAIGTDIIHMHPAAERRRSRRRKPARLPLLRLERGALEGRRLPELRIGRRAARGLPQGGGARAEHRRRRSTA